MRAFFWVLLLALLLPLARGICSCPEVQYSENPITFPARSQYGVKLDWANNQLLIAVSGPYIRNSLTFVTTGDDLNSIDDPWPSCIPPSVLSTSFNAQLYPWRDVWMSGDCAAESNNPFWTEINSLWTQEFTNCSFTRKMTIPTQNFELYRLRDGSQAFNVVSTPQAMTIKGTIVVVFLRAINTTNQALGYRAINHHYKYELSLERSATTKTKSGNLVVMDITTQTVTSDDKLQVDILIHNPSSFALNSSYLQVTHLSGLPADNHLVGNFISSSPSLQTVRLSTEKSNYLSNDLDATLAFKLLSTEEIVHMDVSVSLSNQRIVIDGDYTVSSFSCVGDSKKCVKSPQVGVLGFNDYYYQTIDVSKFKHTLKIKSFTMYLDKSLTRSIPLIDNDRIIADPKYDLTFDVTKQGEINIKFIPGSCGVSSPFILLIDVGIDEDKHRLAQRSVVLAGGATNDDDRASETVTLRNEGVISNTKSTLSINVHVDDETFMESAFFLPFVIIAGVLIVAVISTFIVIVVLLIKKNKVYTPVKTYRSFDEAEDKHFESSY